MSRLLDNLFHYHSDRKLFLELTQDYIPKSKQEREHRIKIIAPFRPHPWQIPVWRDKAKVLLLTGSAGGGKSRIAAEKVHAFLKKYPGAMGLVLRKTRSSTTNSTVLVLDRKIIGNDPDVVHRPSKNRFEYANDSILAYGGMKDREQREQIRSIGQDSGVDIIWMEEATAFDEEDLNELLPRLRAKAAPWRQILLSTNPDGPLHWIKRRLIDEGEAKVYFSSATDNPSNPDDYEETLSQVTGVLHDRLVKGLWIKAEGLVYDVWADGTPDGNVTSLAEYKAGAGEIYWAIDDGYTGKINAKTGTFTANSHPRCFLICQLRHDGTLCVFAEHYAIKTLSDQHIEKILEFKYPWPEYAALDKSAAELRGRLIEREIDVLRGPADVEQSIKELHRRIALDSNQKRLVLVHPRCFHLRQEMANYVRNKSTGKPLKQFDHGPDALRYLAWTTRLEI
jgi:phage terminase large subunit